MNPIVRKAHRLLESGGFAYAICGGFALDLFLGRQTRLYGDIDLSVSEDDKEKIISHMIKHGWTIYAF